MKLLTLVFVFVTICSIAGQDAPLFQESVFLNIVPNDITPDSVKACFCNGNVTILDSLQQDGKWVYIVESNKSMRGERGCKKGWPLIISKKAYLWLTTSAAPQQRAIESTEGNKSKKSKWLDKVTDKAKAKVD